MSNKPWEKWYWKDWLSDTALQSASPCTRGIWVNVLGSMWQQGVYELTMDRSRFCRLIGCSEAELQTFIEEAQALRFCNVSVTEYGRVTVMSRRRKKEDKRNEINRLRQQRYRDNAKRNAQNNGVDPDPDPEEEEDTTIPSLPSQDSRSESRNSGRPQPKKSAVAQCPHQAIIDLYHEKTPCRRVRTWEGQRPGLLRRAWRDHPDLDWWSGFFEYVSESDWLCGRCQPTNGRPVFQADLEWLIRPQNFQKVNEGKYHGIRQANAGRNQPADLH